MERRRFPRQDVREVPLKATLVLAGGSLLKRNLPTAIEIDTHPVNLSRSGVCLSVGLQTTWSTISPAKELELVFERGGERTPVKGRVIHTSVTGQDRFLGVEFSTPLKDVSRFLLPGELH